MDELSGNTLFKYRKAVQDTKIYLSAGCLCWILPKISESISIYQRYFMFILSKSYKVLLPLTSDLSNPS